MVEQVIIIGGGAAGFFSAINIAMINPKIKITIFEKQNKVLQKVKASGGGRCNVTNACFQHSELLKKYPRGKSILKKSLIQFSPKDTIEWFANQGVELHTEADGRIFPTTNSSQTIIDCMLNLCAKYHINIQLQTEIISIQKIENLFELKDKKENKYYATHLIIAVGGYAQILQYSYLQNLELEIKNPVPSLFTFNTPKHSICKLMGVSVANVQVKIVGTKFVETGPLLITHWGFSGPAILKLSAWAAIELHEKKYHFSIHINWIQLSENLLIAQWNDIRNTHAKLHLGNKNPFELPQRLWEYLLEEVDILPQTKWSELNAKQQNKLIHILTTHEIDIKGKTTFKEEFVTCGGIELSQINSNTFESNVIKNVYFAGEILDVDGITGGFNFQHAWSSAYIVAKNITNSFS